MEAKNNSITISEDTHIDAPPPRDLMLLEKRDWKRIKRMTKAIKNSHNWWETGTVFFGTVFITSFVTGVGLQGEMQALLFGIGLASLIITIPFFIGSRTFSKSIQTSKDLVVFEMNDAEEHAKQNSSLLTIPDKFEIIKATYGIGDKNVDVTDKLKGLIKDDKLSTEATNELVNNKDPVPHITKYLNVEYILNGKKLTKKFKETDVVDLP